MEERLLVKKLRESKDLSERRQLREIIKQLRADKSGQVSKTKPNNDCDTHPSPSVYPIPKPVNNMRGPICMNYKSVNQIREPTCTNSESINNIREPMCTNYKSVDNIHEPMCTNSKPVNQIDEPICTNSKPVNDMRESTCTNSDVELDRLSKLIQEQCTLLKKLDGNKNEGERREIRSAIKDLRQRLEEQKRDKRALKSRISESSLGSASSNGHHEPLQTKISPPKLTTKPPLTTTQVKTVYRNYEPLKVKLVKSYSECSGLSEKVKTGSTISGNGDNKSKVRPIPTPRNALVNRPTWRSLSPSFQNGQDLETENSDVIYNNNNGENSNKRYYKCLSKFMRTSPITVSHDDRVSYQAKRKISTITQPDRESLHSLNEIHHRRHSLNAEFLNSFRDKLYKNKMEDKTQPDDNNIGTFVTQCNIQTQPQEINNANTKPVNNQTIKISVKNRNKLTRQKTEDDFSDLLQGFSDTSFENTENSTNQLATCQTNGHHNINGNVLELENDTSHVDNIQEMYGKTPTTPPSERKTSVTENKIDNLLSSVSEMDSRLDNLLVTMFGAANENGSGGKMNDKVDSQYKSAPLPQRTMSTGNKDALLKYTDLKVDVGVNSQPLCHVTVSNQSSSGSTMSQSSEGSNMISDEQTSPGSDSSVMSTNSNELSEGDVSPCGTPEILESSHKAIVLIGKSPKFSDNTSSVDSNSNIELSNTDVSPCGTPEIVKSTRKTIVLNGKSPKSSDDTPAMDTNSNIEPEVSSCGTPDIVENTRKTIVLKGKRQKSCDSSTGVINPTMEKSHTETNGTSPSSDVKVSNFTFTTQKSLPQGEVTDKKTNSGSVDSEKKAFKTFKSEFSFEGLMNGKKKVEESAIVDHDPKSSPDVESKPLPDSDTKGQDPEGYSSEEELFEATTEVVFCKIPDISPHDRIDTKADTVDDKMNQPEEQKKVEEHVSETRNTIQNDERKVTDSEISERKISPSVTPGFEELLKPDVQTVEKADDGSVTVTNVHEFDQGRRTVTVRSKNRRTESMSELEEKDTVVVTDVTSPSGTTFQEVDKISSQRKLTPRGSKYYKTKTARSKYVHLPDGQQAEEHAVLTESQNKSVTLSQSWGDRTLTKVVMDTGEGSKVKAIGGVEGTAEVDGDVSKSKPSGIPEIATPLCDQTICDGESAILKCSVINSPDADVFWYKGTTLLLPSPVCFMSFDNNEAVLEIKNVTDIDAKTYTCAFRNKRGSAETKCRLTLKGSESEMGTDVLASTTELGRTNSFNGSDLMSPDTTIRKIITDGVTTPDLPTPSTPDVTAAKLSLFRFLRRIASDDTSVSAPTSPVSSSPTNEFLPHDQASYFSGLPKSQSIERLNDSSMSTPVSTPTSNPVAAPRSSLTNSILPSKPTIQNGVNLRPNSIAIRPRRFKTWCSSDPGWNEELGSIKESDPHTEITRTPSLRNSYRSRLTGPCTLAENSTPKKLSPLCFEKKITGDIPLNEMENSTNTQNTKQISPLAVEDKFNNLSIPPLDDTKIENVPEVIVKSEHDEKSTETNTNGISNIDAKVHKLPDITDSADKKLTKNDDVKQKLLTDITNEQENSINQEKIVTPESKSAMDKQNATNIISSRVSLMAKLFQKSPFLEEERASVKLVRRHTTKENRKESSVVSQNRPSSPTFYSGAPTMSTPVEEIDDDELLYKMLNQTDNFDERRKIRGRIKEIRARNTKAMEDRRAQATDLAKQRAIDGEELKKKRMEQYAKMAETPTCDNFANTKEKHATNTESKTNEDGSRTVTTTTTKEKSQNDGSKVVSTKKTESTTVTKVSGFGGTAYTAPKADVLAERLASRIQNDTNGSCGRVTVKTESWTSKDGLVQKSETTQRWGAGKPQGPRGAMAAFKQMDAKTTPAGSGPKSPKLTRSNTNSPLCVRKNAVEIKKEILEFCNDNTDEYENVNITNFSACWTNGLAFCALIHHFYPDSFDYSALKPENRRYNFTLAFDTAEKEADIAPLLDVEDMVIMKKPDWKCVFTYVQSIYRHLREHEKNKTAIPPPQ